MKKKKAQSILEYIIVLTAIVAGFLAARTLLQNNATSMLTHVGDVTQQLVNQIDFVQ